MEKPINQLAKDYIIRKMSITMDIPLKTIEAVVNNQFEEAHKALKDNSSIELSGLCKFIFNKKKAGKEYARQQSKLDYFNKILNDPNIDEKRKRSTQLKINSTIKYMEGLKPKLIKYGIIQSVGRMEEQVDSRGENEGNDLPSVSGENESV